MNRVALLLTLGFGLFVAWVIYMANTGQSSIFFQWVKVIPYGDKLGHVSLFGLLTLGLNTAANYKVLQLNGLRIYCGAIGVGIVVVLEELSQYFISSRTFDIADLLAGITGVLLFSLLSYKLSCKSVGDD